MCKRKTARPGVREISLVSIYGEVYGGKDLRKWCISSLEWKRGVIDGDRGGSDLCRVVRRWKTRMWMRLTEKIREFIPNAGCCMLKKTVCNFERWGSRWSGYGDNRRGSSTARRLNSDQFRKIRRLRGSINFISEREKLVLNTFLDL